MIEPAQWIRENADQLGINPENINPASVDVCLGGHVIAFLPNGKRQEQHFKEGDTITFHPDVFYLAHTLEIVTIPNTHAAELILKSSSGRKGLDHANSDWLDPNFTGAVTFEFVAHKRVSFKVGQRIAQIVYARLTEPTDLPYSPENGANYQNQRGATEARNG